MSIKRQGSTQNYTLPPPSLPPSRTFQRRVHPQAVPQQTGQHNPRPRLAITTKHKGHMFRTQIQPGMNRITHPKQRVQRRGLTLPGGRPMKITYLPIQRPTYPMTRLITQIPHQISPRKPIIEE